MDTLEDVRDKIDYEGGFDYFIGGSNFDDVKDEEFHRLRLAFMKAYEELDEYLPEGLED